MGESEWSGQLGQWALAACLAWSSTLRSHPLPEERCSTLRNSDPPPSGAILYPEERCPPPKQWSPTLRSHPLSREEVLHSLKQWSSTFRSFSAEPLERRFILTVFLMFDWFTQSKHERQFYGPCCQRDWGVSSQSVDQVSCGGICIENIVW